MPRANEIKKGMVLNYNGKLLIVKDIDIQAPSARGAATLYKMRFSDVRTGLKVEERFKGDDIVDTVTLTRRYVDFPTLTATNTCSWIKKITPRISSPKIRSKKSCCLFLKVECRTCRC